jgi:hypothetical protein
LELLYRTSRTLGKNLSSVWLPRLNLKENFPHGPKKLYFRTIQMGPNNNPTKYDKLIHFLELGLFKLEFGLLRKSRFPKKENAAIMYF